jgi:hypothetical protein
LSGGRLAAVGHVLELVRCWAPVYRRWWDHPCRWAPGGVEPWSVADEERWAWLGGIVPERAAAVAGELRSVSAELATHRGSLAEVAAGGGLPEAAAQWCASLARAVGVRATDTALLADAVGRAAQDADMLLDALVDRVSSVAASLAEASAYPSPGRAHLDIDVADRLPSSVPDPDRWRSLDTFVARHGAVLAELRAHLSDAADRLGRGARSGLGAWCDGDTGCQPTPPWWPPLGQPPSAAPLPPASVPGTGIPAPHVDVWMSEPWQPLPAAPDSGPLLPGTEGSRPGTDTGVRVAQLPDRLAGAGP